MPHQISLRTMDNSEEKHPGEEFFQEAASLCHERRSFLAYLKTLAPIGKTRNFVNSDEYEGDVCGFHVFIKTFANRWLPVRLFYGARCIDNEYNANAAIRAKNLARVAIPYCKPSRYTAFFQYIPNAGQLENPRHHRDFVIPDRAFFRELIEYIRNMHKNGICHGDLRRANILVGNDGHPWLVDTASAIVLPQNPGMLKKYAFKCMVRSDLFSLSKIVFSYYPDWQDEELRAAYERQPLFLKLGRYARHYLYALLRRKRRKTLKIKN